MHLQVNILPSVKHLVNTVVYWGTVSEDVFREAELVGVTVHAYQMFLQGAAAVEPVEAIHPKPEDPACIMYTRYTGGGGVQDAGVR